MSSRGLTDTIRFAPIVTSSLSRIRSAIFPSGRATSNGTLVALTSTPCPRCSSLYFREISALRVHRDAMTAAIRPDEPVLRQFIDDVGSAEYVPRDAVSPTVRLGSSRP